MRSLQEFNKGLGSYKEVLRNEIISLAEKIDPNCACLIDILLIEFEIIISLLENDDKPSFKRFVFEKSEKIDRIKNELKSAGYIFYEKEYCKDYIRIDVMLIDKKEWGLENVSST